MVIKTPSGYSVELKDFLTFGQRRAIEKLLISKSKINPQTQSLSDIEPSLLYEVQDEAFKMLVTKIINDKGTVVEGDLFKFVNELPEEDGQLIYKTINDITNSQGKKK